MLKGNATAFSDAENILFGPKYEKILAKSLSSKNKSKEFFRSIKNQRSFNEGNRRQSFRKGSQFLEPEEIGEDECSQLLVKPYNNNTLHDGKEGVRMNLLIAPSITSTGIL